MESPKNSPQAIELNLNCLGQAHSNRPGTGPGYATKEPKSILTISGGYSNLGARGKNFQKFMLSEKKKRSDLGLDIFLPKSKYSLKKKKKKGLHSKSSTERIQN